MIVLLYLQGFTAGYANEKITQTQSSQKVLFKFYTIL